jgi:crossover junction endodeoxyribonuclease RusA
MRLFVSYPPSTNRLWRSTKGGRQYLAPEVAAWKQQVAYTAKACGVEVSESPMAVTIRLHPKITKTGQASKRRIDLDNAIKVSLDALNGIAWVDDNQVVELHAWLDEPMTNGALTILLAER